MTLRAAIHPRGKAGGGFWQINKNMEIKFFGENKIIIRELQERDKKIVKQWQKYINALVDENTYITVFKKISIKEEEAWLASELKKIRQRKAFVLVAENNNEIAGSVSIEFLTGKQSHIGRFGITISKKYRGCGLGSYLTGKAISAVKEKFGAEVKIIELGAFAENKIALDLYKRAGFTRVARIPNRFCRNGKLIDEIVMHYCIK